MFSPMTCSVTTGLKQTRETDNKPNCGGGKMKSPKDSVQTAFVHRDVRAMQTSRVETAITWEQCECLWHRWHHQIALASGMGNGREGRSALICLCAKAAKFVREGETKGQNACKVVQGKDCRPLKISPCIWAVQGRLSFAIHRWPLLLQ